MKVNLVPDDAGKVPPTPQKVFGPVGKLPAFQRGLVLTFVQTHAPVSRDNPVCRNTERDFLHQQAVSLEKMFGSLDFATVQISYNLVIPRRDPYKHLDIEWFKYYSSRLEVVRMCWTVVWPLGRQNFTFRTKTGY